MSNQMTLPSAVALDRTTVRITNTKRKRPLASFEIISYLIDQNGRYSSPRNSLAILSGSAESVTAILAHKAVFGSSLYILVRSTEQTWSNPVQVDVSNIQILDNGPVWRTDSVLENYPVYPYGNQPTPGFALEITVVTDVDVKFSSDIAGTQQIVIVGKNDYYGNYYNTYDIRTSGQYSYDLSGSENYDYHWLVTALYLYGGAWQVHSEPPIQQINNGYIFDFIQTFSHPLPHPVPPTLPHPIPATIEAKITLTFPGKSKPGSKHAD